MKISKKRCLMVALGGLSIAVLTMAITSKNNLQTIRAVSNRSITIFSSDIESSLSKGQSSFSKGNLSFSFSGLGVKNGNIVHSGTKAGFLKADTKSETVYGSSSSGLGYQEVSFSGSNISVGEVSIASYKNDDSSSLSTLASFSGSSPAVSLDNASYFRIDIVQSDFEASSISVSWKCDSSLSRLATPSLSVTSGNALSWNEIIGASEGYQVTVKEKNNRSSSLYSNSSYTGTSLDLSSLGLSAEGEYTAYVTSNAVSGSYLASATGTLDFTYQPLWLFSNASDLSLFSGVGVTPSISSGALKLTYGGDPSSHVIRFKHVLHKNDLVSFSLKADLGESGKSNAGLWVYGNSSADEADTTAIPELHFVSSGDSVNVSISVRSDTNGLYIMTDSDACDTGVTLYIDNLKIDAFDGTLSFDNSSENGYFSSRYCNPSSPVFAVTEGREKIQSNGSSSSAWSVLGLSVSKGESVSLDVETDGKLFIYGSTNGNDPYTGTGFNEIDLFGNNSAKHTVTFTAGETYKNLMISDSGSSSQKIYLDNLKIGTFSPNDYSLSLYENGGKINLGVWNGSYTTLTEDNVLDLKEAGIDTLLGNFTISNSFLDTLSNNGMVVIPDSRSWNGEIPNFVNHDSFNGYCVYDEPSSSAFSSIANEKFLWETNIGTEKKFFVNLLPGYADSSSLGGTLDSYVSGFVSAVDPDILSFDYYPLESDTSKESGVSLREGYYSNLDVYSHYAKSSSIPLWVSVLSAGHASYITPDLQSLRYEMNVSLTYGAKGIFHYIYSSHESGYSPIVDMSGDTTSVYETVKEADNEFRNWDDIYSSFDWSSTFAMDEGSTNPMFSSLAYEGSLSDASPVLTSVTSDQDLLVGVFNGPSSSKAFMVTNATSPADDLKASVGLTISSDYEAALTIKNGIPSIERIQSGSLSLSLGRGEAAFVVPLSK